MKAYATKAAANAAAHRFFKKEYGSSYMAVKGVDFTVGFSYSRGGWVFDRIGG